MALLSGESIRAVDRLLGRERASTIQKYAHLSDASVPEAVMTGRTRMRLTDAGAAKLKPARTEYIVWDTRVAGLGVWISPSENRSFVWHGQMNGRAVRTTVGSVAVTTVEEALLACLALQNGEGPSGGDDGKAPSAVPLFQDIVLSSKGLTDAGFEAMLIETVRELGGRARRRDRGHQPYHLRNRYRIAG